MSFIEESRVLVQDIANILSSKKQTLAVAESCTGGLLSAQLTNLSGISSVYLGSVVSYANSAKETLLDVPREILENHGAVSRETSLRMAQGVRLRLRSSWGVAITGIAGPSGGTADKPVGTVWFAVVGPGFEQAVVKHLIGDRMGIREGSVLEALRMLREALNS